MGYSRPRSIAVMLVGDYTANVTDSLTYYWGGLHALALSTTADSSRVYIPVSGFIRRALLYIYCGTPSTAETIAFSLRKNNTTDYAIETKALSANKNTVSNLNMAVPVSEGDYIEVKCICPAWATNPAGITPRGVIVIEFA